MNRTAKKRFTLKAVLGLFFILAFTLPAVVTSVVFWQHTTGLNQDNENYVARAFAANARQILRLKHEEYLDLLNHCKETQGPKNTDSPLVFCGIKDGPRTLTPVFHNGINSDSFRAESIIGSPWWAHLGDQEKTGWLMEAQTGIEPAYYKKYVLIYEREPDNRILFALVDPLPLMSALISAASDMGTNAVFPVLTSDSGGILFAPQAAFYRALFNDKSYQRLLHSNSTLLPLPNDSDFSIDGNRFVLHFIKDLGAGDAKLDRLKALLFYNFGLIILFGFLGVLVVLSEVSEPVVNLANEVARVEHAVSHGSAEDLGNIVTGENGIREISRLQSGIVALLNSIRQRDKKVIALNEQLKEKEILARVGETSAQIAHDIRSPLSALKMALTFVQDLQEDERLMFRSAVTRIEDIANTLSASKDAPHETDDANGGMLPCLLTSVVEPVITEKRLKYRPRLDIEINLVQEPSSYGRFAHVNPGQLKRVISNLIDNAVEASDQGGKIDVVVSGRDLLGIIHVRDRGKGIPPEILQKLGQKGVTNKPGGSGRGIYPAIETLKAWGGKLTFSSPATGGTVAAVEIPNVDPPSWFVPSLSITPETRVVILDDDASIHQVLQSRFAGLGGKIEVQSFSKPGQLIAFHGNSNRESNVLYLLDYELLGERLTGLDLVQELGIERQAVLVTSHFEDPELRRMCEKLAVRIIPKGLASQVPIYFVRGRELA